ncbi:MAG TPA: SRPBCC family protein [Gaiellaceae bacterium]
MATDVQVEQRIGRPRAEVAAYVTDWRNDPTWIKALSDVRLLSEPPLRVGSRVERVANFRGRTIEYVNEVAALEPDSRLEMKAVDGPFPMSVVYEFADAGEGTLVRIHARGDATGFYRLVGPVLSRAVKRTIAADLKRLKKVLEQA